MRCRRHRRDTAAEVHEPLRPLGARLRVLRVTPLLPAPPSAGALYYKTLNKRKPAHAEAKGAPTADEEQAELLLAAKLPNAAAGKAAAPQEELLK